MDLTFTIVQIQKQSFDSFLKCNRVLKSHVNVKVNLTITPNNSSLDNYLHEIYP